MSPSPSRTLWDEGRQPGREMVTLGIALALTLAALDLGLTGRLSVLFDIGFVVLSAALALAVRPGDFFSVGVLPPLLMLVTFVLLALMHARGIAEPGEGVLSVVVAGLGHHSISLLLGYLACLGILFVRRSQLRRQSSTPSTAPNDTTGLTRSGQDRRLPV